jgi:dihydrodipicolinate synthase/N-acetylneuraminate lyase
MGNSTTPASSSPHAERAGAAAVMVVPPFYVALPWRELLAHYSAVADAIDIPIVYYNLPSATGVTLTAEQFRALPIAALKDTGGDASAATELLLQTDGPTLLNGYDTQTFAALAAGVRAVVWGVASIVPEPCVELHRLLIDEIDLPAARVVGAPVANVAPSISIAFSGEWRGYTSASCERSSDGGASG